MIFEWDENKNRENLRKHGIDFCVVGEFPWHDAAVFNRTREEDYEQRYAAIGFMNNKLYTVIFTKRGKQVRIISFRRANKTEEKAYEQEK